MSFGVFNVVERVERRKFSHLNKASVFCDKLVPMLHGSQVALLRFGTVVLFTARLEPLCFMSGGSYGGVGCLDLLRRSAAY
jgi:hypothetical protein